MQFFFNIFLFQIKYHFPATHHYKYRQDNISVYMLLDLWFYIYVLQTIVCPFVYFLLAVGLSVPLRYTDSDYPFGIFKLFLQSQSGRRGHDRMVVGFTTIYSIGAYHHPRCEFESRSGELYSIQHYVMQFVSDLQQVGGFHRFLPPIKLTVMIQLKYC